MQVDPRATRFAAASTPRPAGVSIGATTGSATGQASPCRRLLAVFLHAAFGLGLGCEMSPLIRRLPPAATR